MIIGLKMHILHLLSNLVHTAKQDAYRSYLSTIFEYHNLTLVYMSYSLTSWGKRKSVPQGI